MNFHDIWLILTAIGALGFLVLGILLRINFGVKNFKVLFTLMLVNYISIAIEQICADVRASSFSGIEYFATTSIIIGLVGRGLEVFTTILVVWYIVNLFKAKEE